MSIKIYNVDKEFPFREPVAVEVTGNLSLFYQVCEDISGMGIECTRPQFLAAFRRVKHDGTIAGLRNLETLDMFDGTLIIVDNDGSIAFKLKDISNKYYWEFDNNVPQKCVLRYEEVLDLDSIKKITLDEWNSILDSYKIEKPKPPKNNKIYLGDFINDYDDEDLLEEL